jgi:AcrR family transcriptional regulator
VDPHGRRREAGAASRVQTRARLLRAADELFRENGYPATTVTAIADHAGVSLQTLYLAWGSKSALFRAAADAAVTGSGMPLTAQEWRERIRERLTRETGDDLTAPRYLGAVAHVFVQVAGRTAPYWQMQPAAAATDPDIAAGHLAAMRLRRATMQGVAAQIPTAGLRPGLSSEEIGDTLWAVASPETYAMFTRQAGKSQAEFEDWLTTTLVAALCAA